jgi:hypothetical protein
MKRPKTGGGPKPTSPTPVEQQVLDSLEGRPSLKGLDLGFDTGGKYMLIKPVII